MQLDPTQIPTWFMALAVITLCAFTIYFMKKRDCLIDTIAKTIYGSENKDGLVTRMSVLETTIDRCNGCAPHHDGGRRPKDPEHRP